MENTGLADNGNTVVEASGGRPAQLQWSSRLTFILAATGSAVGLGNIWKFPYVTGVHGGGAFVLIYLACILVIGLPLLMAEVMLGRRGRQNPANSMANLAREFKVSRHWRLLGWLGVVSGFLILSFYTVVAGWALSYIFDSARGAFDGLSGEQAGAHFGRLLADPGALIFWGTLVLLITLGVVARGVKQGLEKAVNAMMPGLFVLLLVLVGYAMTTGFFMQGLNFLFNPDFSKLSGTSILVALGHAFFTLSLAGGGMMTYGSYLPQHVSIAKTAITIGILDTLVALLAGMVIFPLVFANGLEPGSGPGLLFVTLPIAFGQMPFGALFGMIFFIMLSVAALTSAISLIEPAVAWMTEKYRVSRFKACLMSGLVMWVLSLGTVFSFNIWEQHTLFGKTFFGVLDYLTSGWFLPLGGLFIAIFAGWVMTRRATEQELGRGLGYRLWYYTIRYISPVAIVIMFLNAIGVIG
ncbi:sodium-dependent transporter [Zobellella maritima]|uniref:sodium-dependent transporter n=1 Tax=Zobellella maritima TaxID=2059725 RepID=UPI000E302AF0|nr:sodium-dependent transporter [Zobellella maritima]